MLLFFLLTLGLPLSWPQADLRSPRAPLPRPATPVGIPYGFWGLNGEVHPTGLAAARRHLGMTVFHTATVQPAWAVDVLLPMVRAAGLQVTLRMTGDHPRYTTATGDFDLDAWKAQLAPWASADVQPFIADGTLLGHMLLDDIHNFPGHDPTAAELDEMARLSKALFPDLMTFVREKATAMPPPQHPSGTYQQVDAIVNQYKAAEGDVRAYVTRESARARALDLGVINGLNIANGGDGSSGQPGWGKDKFAMSAAEIRAYGAVLAADPDCAMFLNWEYDGKERWSDKSIGKEYFDRSDLRVALHDLGTWVATHPPVPLLRRSLPPPP